MNKKEMLSDLRMYLADSAGLIWKDDFLNNLLDEALKQYCIDSGAFVGVFDFIPDKNGIYAYPEDYASFMIGWNKAGDEINQVSGRELFHLSCNNINRSGDVRYIYDDQSSNGCFSLYPQAINNQNIKEITINGFYGEVLDNDFGVYLDDDYGVSLSVMSYDFAGEIYYKKLGDFESIKDYSAVIYYALFLAYNSDSDLGNAENAVIWKRRYTERLNAFSTFQYNNSGIGRTGNFF